MRLGPSLTRLFPLAFGLLLLASRSASAQAIPSETKQSAATAPVVDGQFRYLLVGPQGVERGSLHAEILGAKAALRQLEREMDRNVIAKNDLIAHLRFGTQPLSLDSVAPRLALIIQTRSSLPVAPAWYRLGAPTDHLADMYVKVIDPAAPRDSWTLQEGYLVIEASATKAANGRLGAVFRSTDGQTLTISGRFMAVAPPAGRGPASR